MKGYYECAYLRYVDIVCSGIHYELFANIKDSMREQLEDKLGVINYDGQYLILPQDVKGH